MTAADSLPQRTPLHALGLVLGAVDAVRNTRALFLLLGTFCVAGLLLAMAESALARDAGWWGPLEAGAALFAAFYGGNAVGILVMDEARGEPWRDGAQALRTSLLTAHRLLLVLALLGAGYALLGGAVVGLFWLCRVAVTGATFGPLLFGAAVPLGVVLLGTALLSVTAVVIPLAGPGVWEGAGVLPLVRHLVHLMRRRLLTVVLLMVAVSLLTAGMGALVSSVVLAGGRMVALLGVHVVGVDVPAQQLMAGLFGYGLRSLGAAGAPAGSTGHAAAALVGGGLVFVLALVLPALVYVRGTCTVYLALRED